MSYTRAALENDHRLNRTPVGGEHALSIPFRDQSLVGILHAPVESECEPSDTAIVIVVGGPQIRAGSHRQFVLMARAFAAARYPVLRFDLAGMGDSAGEPANFEAASDDIGTAIDALLKRLPSVKQVVLWGLCDGASASLLYWRERRDPRVVALALANPWVRTEASQARTQVKHYYRDRLRQPEFWLKLLRGGVAFRAAKDLVLNLQRSATSAKSSSVSANLPFPERMAQAWRDFGGEVLLLLSENDFTAKEFLDQVAVSPAWSNALSRKRLQREDLAGADHTFSNAVARQTVIDATLRWLNNLDTNARADAR